MPELPEVETICRNLRPRLCGLRITGIDVFEPRLRSRVGDDFASKLQSRMFLDVERKGKYIVARLDGPEAWIFHLGMSGKLVHVKGKRPRERHDHIIARLENGEELRYHDPRRFGLSVIVPAADLDQCGLLKNLGVDPLGSQFNADYLYSIMRKSRRRVRDLLIDQRVVAGLGNIYANEILFRAGVRPMRRAWRISSVLVARITGATPAVLGEAIRLRGTSISDYRDGNDRKGEFQNYLQVYGREGKGCRACSGMIKNVRMGNRSAFYCPTCQH
jgi:formamidopyrimidine-DNA glycosylase